MKKSVFDLTTSEWAAAASAAGQAAARKAAERGRTVRGALDVSTDDAKVEDIALQVDGPADVPHPVRSRRVNAA